MSVRHPLNLSEDERGRELGGPRVLWSDLRNFRTEELMKMLRIALSIALSFAAGALPAQVTAIRAIAIDGACGP